VSVPADTGIHNQDWSKLQNNCDKDITRKTATRKEALDRVPGKSGKHLGSGEIPRTKRPDEHHSPRIEDEPLGKAA
jgi:hypothetical protein